jgi:hypothetical protein
MASGELSVSDGEKTSFLILRVLKKENIKMNFFVTPLRLVDSATLLTAVNSFTVEAYVETYESRSVIITPHFL